MVKFYGCEPVVSHFGLFQHQVVGLDAAPLVLTPDLSLHPQYMMVGRLWSVPAVYQIWGGALLSFSPVCAGLPLGFILHAAARCLTLCSE